MTIKNLPISTQEKTECIIFTPKKKHKTPLFEPGIILDTSINPTGILDVLHLQKLVRNCKGPIPLVKMVHSSSKTGPPIWMMENQQSSKFSAIFLRFRTSWKNQTNSLVAMWGIQSGESVTSVVQTKKNSAQHKPPKPFSVGACSWGPLGPSSNGISSVGTGTPCGVGSWFDRVKIYVWMIYPPGPP